MLPKKLKFLRAITAALLKELPVPLMLALMDGKLTSEEIKDLSTLTAQTVANTIAELVESEGVDLEIEPNDPEVNEVIREVVSEEITIE